LIEHYDFEALYPSVWKHLYSWYSADIQIVRYLKKDVLNRHVMILDLYPDSESMLFNGYAYASGCQNLFSGGHNSVALSQKDSLTHSAKPPDLLQQNGVGGGDLDLGNLTELN